MTKKDEDRPPTQLEKLRKLLIEDEDPDVISLYGGDVFIEGGPSGGCPPEMLEWWYRCRGQVTGNEFTTVSGGAENLASGIYSAIPGGRGARMDQYGALAMGNQKYNGVFGCSQWMTVLLSGETVEDETVNLTLNGESDGDELEVFKQSIWVFNINISFNCTHATHLGYFSGGDGMLYRLAGDVNGSFTQPSYVSGAGSPLPGVSINCTYSGANFRIAATGYTGLTHHWVARVNIAANGRGI